MSTNHYGVDVRYFREKLLQLVRDVENYRPEELARALKSLSETAAPVDELGIREDVKRILARWERHLDGIEPQTVGHAVDIDMERDDLEVLAAFIEKAERIEAHARKMVKLHEKRGCVLSVHMQELEELLQ